MTSAPDSSGDLAAHQNTHLPVRLNLCWCLVCLGGNLQRATLCTLWLKVSFICGYLWLLWAAIYSFTATGKWLVRLQRQKESPVKPQTGAAEPLRRGCVHSVWEWLHFNWLYWYGSTWRYHRFTKKTPSHFQIFFQKLLGNFPFNLSHRQTHTHTHWIHQVKPLQQNPSLSLSCIYNPHLSAGLGTTWHYSLDRDHQTTPQPYITGRWLQVGSCVCVHVCAKTYVK